MKILRYGLATAAAIGLFFVLIWTSSKGPVETYEQYSARCLKPQPEPFKRDFTCINDAHKFGSVSSSQSG
jgi:hypothetical protein